jgi:competence ComEA-like helix-hairpin-helix protein
VINDKIKKAILLSVLQPTLFLALACLFVYIIKNHILTDPLKNVDELSSSKSYIEVVKSGDFPVIYSKENLKQLKRMIPSSLYTRIKSGDKVIIYDKNSFSLLRMSGKKSLAIGIPIGVNSAGIDDLTALSGVGIKLAKNIVNYRESIGGFKSIDELNKVKGMGKKKIEAMKPFINLD